MSEHNSEHQRVEPGVTPPADARAPGILPPVIPPPLLRPPKRGLSPWAIVAVCVGCGVTFVVLGLLTAGWLAAGKARAMRVEQARAAATAAAAARQQWRSERVVVPQVHRISPRGAHAEPGITYTNVVIPGVPWSIHVLAVDRSHRDLGFHAAHAQGQVLGVSLIADQARAIPREMGGAIAGVNGDFYLRDDPTYAGDPRGLQIVSGELISAPDTWSVWFDADGNPHLDEVTADFNVTWPDGRKTRLGLNELRRPSMAVLYTPTYGASTRVGGGRELILEKDGEGPWLPLQAGETYRARVREVRVRGNTPLAGNRMVLSLAPDLLPGLPDVAPGDVLQVSTATTPDLRGAPTAIGGGPALVVNGRAFSDKTPPPGISRAFSERSKYERHPRSAVGWSPTHVYLVTVDGRQSWLSVGMKLAELAEFMADLGCTEAMNFDGGKSAQMWLNGRIVNSPCQGVDTVANCLLVIRKTKKS